MGLAKRKRERTEKSESSSLSIKDHSFSCAPAVRVTRCATLRCAHPSDGPRQVAVAGGKAVFNLELEQVGYVEEVRQIEEFFKIRQTYACAGGRPDKRDDMLNQGFAMHVQRMGIIGRVAEGFELAQRTDNAAHMCCSRMDLGHGAGYTASELPAASGYPLDLGGAVIFAPGAVNAIDESEVLAEHADGERQTSMWS